MRHLKHSHDGAVAELVGIEGGVVSEVLNLESSGVEAPDRRPRHNERYHEVRFHAACRAAFPRTSYSNTLGPIMLDPSTVLRDLVSRDPVRLAALPHDHGIYALHDHTGTMRYIGITKSHDSGFFDRIHNRHVTGSEGRSHKFSQAYNTGRMWRAKRDSRPDACLAKRLRTEFIRRHCRATFVTVPLPLCPDLPTLEIAVQALAPESMLDWGGKRGFVSLSEPTALVDALLDDLLFSPEQRAAIERQAALHAKEAA